MKPSHYSKWFHAMVAMACIALSPQARAAGTGWCSISGKVVGVEASSFRVDCGSGVVVVKMKNWDWFGEDRLELRGLKVRMSGRILRNSSEPEMKVLGIYLPSHHIYHYLAKGKASAMAYATISKKRHSVLVSGKVTRKKVSEFTLDTGDRRLTISTRALPYNPLDDVGHQKIKVGDAVVVSAMLERKFFAEGRVEAKTVTSMIGDLRK